MTKALLAAACLAFTTSANAFTLDFVGLEGTTVPPTLTINVPGYGDVSFASKLGTMEVGQTYQNDPSPTNVSTSLEFSVQDTLTVEFKGLPVFDVDFDFAGVSVGEVFFANHEDAPNTFVITLIGDVDGAGLQAVSWQAIPEPSSALLGGLGTMLLLTRRRRA